MSDRLAHRPTLVLHLDEGSPSYAMCWYMQYFLKLRFVFIRDIYHREWNDMCLALKACSLWSVVVMSTVVFNLHHGPWNGCA